MASHVSFINVEHISCNVGIVSSNDSSLSAETDANDIPWWSRYETYLQYLHTVLNQLDSKTVCGCLDIRPMAPHVILQYCFTSRNSGTVSVQAMLNHDVLHLIYESLSARDLAVASQVCRLWYSASKKDLLWKKHFMNDLDPFGRTAGANLTDSYRQNFISKLAQIRALTSCGSARRVWSQPHPKLRFSSVFFCCGQNAILAYTVESSFIIRVFDVSSGDILHTRSWDAPYGSSGPTAHTLDHKWLFTKIGSVFYRLECNTLEWTLFDLPDFRHALSMFPLSEKSVVVDLNSQGFGPSNLCRLELEEGRAAWSLKDWPTGTTIVFNSNYLIASIHHDQSATYTVDPIDGWSRKVRNQTLSGITQLLSPKHILHNYSFVLDLPKCLTAIELPKLTTVLHAVVGGCLLYQITIDRKIRIINMLNPNKPEMLANIKWPSSDRDFVAATADDCGNIIFAFRDRVEKWTMQPEIQSFVSSSAEDV